MSGSFLTKSQRDAFVEDGFLALPGFVAETDCLALRARAVELAREVTQDASRATVFRADGASPHQGDDWFLSSGEAIRGFYEDEAFAPDGTLRAAAHECLNKLGHAMHDLDASFDAFSRTEKLAAVASSIGMRDPLLLQSMYIFKNPRIGGEVQCHADHTYLWTEPRSVVGFWFAIDDATTENGCMWALPGGHRIPVKSRSRLDATRTRTVIDVLDSTPYPTEGLVPLEAKRGTLILLDGALPHLSGPNRSEHPRHAYTLHAIDGAARYLDDNWLRRERVPLRGFA
jgi:phytanoyl-CoA hydroxylase